jgi:mono/diheme cytochrome c family protein
MISARMRRARQLFLVSAASIATAAVASGCGTQKINVPKTQSALYEGATLFNQRCAGCHTLSYAATHGSAANVRTAQYNNGPNFDVRCERPVTRVLYAIENGGFSGAIMPQNVVVGHEAADVAKFVATYAGRHSPKVPGVPSCTQEAVGALPAPAAAASTTSSTTSTTAATATTTIAAAKNRPAVKNRSTKTQAKAKRKP